MDILAQKKRAVLYLRYSSANQTEQSIEGQRHVCQKFAASQGYVIVREYIDRATSASKDTSKRVNFLQMIKDSSNRTFDSVIVYKTDRFSRDRYDFAYYKKKLKDHGVKVISATEGIDDRPESIIMESVLEGFAEYYSKELSQKVTRGMRESASKCQYLGGPVPLGLLVEDKKYIPDPKTAPMVKKIFEDYVTGKSLREIACSLTDAGLRTKAGKPYNAMAIKRIIGNSKYIGVYEAKDVSVEGAIEAIVDPETFQKANERLAKNRRFMRKRSDKPEYLLSGKIFCGHCGYGMVPDSGTSKTGKVYFYYKCNGKKSMNICHKHNEKKEVIEDLVIQDAVKLLDDKNMNLIADMILEELENESPGSELDVLKEELKQVDKELDNLATAVASGIINQVIKNKLDDADQRKNDIERRIMELEASRSVFTRENVLEYLNVLKDKATKDETLQKTLIDAFVERVEVFDDDDGGGYLRILYRLDQGSSPVVTLPLPFSTSTELFTVILDGQSPKIVHGFRFNRG